jgi:hypothetical protein
VATNSTQRWRRNKLASSGLLAATLAVSTGTHGFAQQAAAPQTFHTTARFSVDVDVLSLQTAVAFAAPHTRFKEYSWVRIYFYAFPLTAGDVAAASSGTIDALERKRVKLATGAADLNHSRAVLHFLLDKDAKLSNASLEVPGLTCTILEDPATARNAVQVYQNDGKRLQVKAKGSSMCDLASIGGAKHSMNWDVDVNIPLFTEH